MFFKMATGILQDVWNLTPDPRTDHYFFSQSIYTPLIIVTVYCLFVMKIGPQIMEDRKPFDLKRVILAYNVFQIISNAALFLSFVIHLETKSLFCDLIDTSTDQKGLLKVYLAYLYFLLKLSDLTETIFYVLRKKHNQISLLHLHHHITMVLLSWIFFRYFPGGQTSWVGYANTLVHMIMYSYYFLTTYLGEAFKKHLWWKKCITQIQIIQQVFLAFIFTVPIFVPGCQYPSTALYIALPNGLLILGFFVNFYVQSYLKYGRRKTRTN